MRQDTLINLEAEAAILGLMMQANETIEPVADRIGPDAFALPAHAAIFSALIDQSAKGKPAKPMTIKTQVEPMLGDVGGPAYLARLTGEIAPVSAKDGADLLSDLAHRRRMREGLACAAQDCADLAIAPAEIVSRADAAMQTAAQQVIHQPTGGECLDELIAGFGEQRNGVTCQSIPTLDHLLGPMRPKQLIIGAGRPGMGKTAVALSYGLGAAQAGHGVMFVSLEMSSAELAARMASDLCHDRTPIQFSKIRDGTLSRDELREVYSAREFMHDLPFQVIDAGNLPVGRLNMLIRRHKRRMAAQGQKLELVIVDYLQLLSPDTKGRSAYEAVSEVSRALKAMAKDHGVAIFALAQLSRSVEQRPDKRPQLSDLRDSGQIEQDADAVLFLLRQEYYLRQDEPEPHHEQYAAWQRALDDHAGKIEFIVAKRRNGVTGSGIGMFYGAHQAVRK